MSGVVANIKRCKKCKNIYDANIGLNMIRCPYCFHEQVHIFIPVPDGHKPKHRIPHWPFKPTI